MPDLIGYKIMTIERRFAGRLTEEYKLVALAYPHIDEFQFSVASIVSLYVKSRSSAKLKILEIGSGDGITTDLLLGEIGNNLLVAIDSEPQMVTLATSNLQSLHSSKNFSVECHDALLYLRSLPDQSLDVIVSVWTLHNFLKSYREEVLNEIFRVLKTEGMFINGDKFAQDTPTHFKNLDTQLRRFFDSYLPINKHDFLRDFVLHNVSDESPERLLIEAEYIKTLKMLGYKEIIVSYRECMEAIIVAEK